MRRLLALLAAAFLTLPLRADDEGRLADQLFDSVMRTRSAGQSLLGAGGGELLREAVGEAARQLQADRAAGVEPSAEEAPPPDMEVETLKSLDRLARAYTNKRRAAIMSLVSARFAGSASVLEDGLASDFRAYQLINFRVVPDKPEASEDHASVQFRYDLTLLDFRGGRSQFEGRQRWEFRLEDGLAKLSKVDSPPIFGHSLPAGEGAVMTSQGPSPTSGSAAPGCGDPIGGTTSSEDRLNGPRFRTQTIVDFGLADVYLNGPQLITQNGIKLLGSGAIDTFHSAGVTYTSRRAAWAVGAVYAVRTASDKYALIRVTGVEPASVDAMGTPIPAKAALEFRYQPRGESCF